MMVAVLALPVMDAVGPSVIESRYVGAASAMSADLGAEGGRGSLTAEIFGGLQLGRWMSTEGFFTYHASSAFRESESGEPCRSAPVDQWSWNAFGSRLWVHLYRARFLAVSVAPMIAFGLAHARQEAVQNFRVPSCARPTSFFTGWTFSGGIDFSIEVRPTSWLGIRTMLSAGGSGGSARFLSFAVLSIGWSLGPVFRF